jgi:hypothetical protein
MRELSHSKIFKNEKLRLSFYKLLIFQNQIPQQLLNIHRFLRINPGLDL